MIKNKRKFIDITTSIIYLMLILSYELLYCNIDFINGKTQYYFSIYRIIVYIIIYLLYFIFKKKFIETSIKSFESDRKIKVSLILFFLATLYLFYMLANIIIIKNITMVQSLTIIGALMLYLFIIYFSNDLIKNTIVICLTFGILFSISITANNQLDEKKHFLSVYSLSLGDLDTVNHSVDLSISDIGRRIPVSKFNEYFNKYPENNITKNFTVDDECDRPAGGNYEITYIVPAIGVAIARILGGSIADIYFTGRIFNLLSFCVLICITFKILPFKKNTFFICAFMPMALALACVYSADSTTFGLVMIFVAYCLKLAYQEDRITIKQLYLLALTLMLACICKGIGYICIAFAIFILPIKKIFKDNKNNLKYIILLIFLVISILGILLLINAKTAATSGGDPRSEGSNASEQLTHVLENPLQYFGVLYNHFKTSIFNIKSIGFLYGPMFFGYDTYYYVFAITLPFYLLIGILDNSKSLKFRTRIIFIITSLALFAFTSTALYISYTKVGSKYIEGFQMRYIIPILPLILSCLSIKKLKFLKKLNKKPEDNNIAVVSFIGLLMTVSYYFILVNIV